MLQNLGFLFVFKERELVVIYQHLADSEGKWAGEVRQEPVNCASQGWPAEEGKLDLLLWWLSATLRPKLRWMAWLTSLYYDSSLLCVSMDGGWVLGGDSRKRKPQVWP